MRMASLPVLLVLLAPAPSAAARDAGPEEQVWTDCYGDPLPAGAVARMGTVRLRQGEWFRSIALAPDGKTVAASDEATICLWDVISGRLLHRFATSRRASFPSLLFSTDGARLIALENGRPAVLRQWEAATGKELPPRQIAQPYAHGGRLVAITPDGNGLLGFGERTIHLWDFATRKPLRHFQAPVERFRYVALSPDGKTLAATAQASSFKVSTSVYLWDVAGGKARPSLDGHDEGAYCVAFAPDGKTLVAADPKNNYRWEFP